MEMVSGVVVKWGDWDWRWVASDEGEVREGWREWRNVEGEMGCW